MFFLRSARFDEFASETTADKNAKAATLDSKEKASVAKKKALSQANRDLKATQTELDAAMTCAGNSCASKTPSSVSSMKTFATLYRSVQHPWHLWKHFQRKTP